MIIDGDPLKPLIRGSLVRLREGVFMGNRVTAVRMVTVRSGTELQGIARSDRGTKYILGSIVVVHQPGMRKEVQSEIAAAVEMILKGRN